MSSSRQHEEVNQSAIRALDDEENETLTPNLSLKNTKLQRNNSTNQNQKSNEEKNNFVLVPNSAAQEAEEDCYCNNINNNNNKKPRRMHCCYCKVQNLCTCKENEEKQDDDEKFIESILPYIKSMKTCDVFDLRIKFLKTLYRIVYKENGNKIVEESIDYKPSKPVKIMNDTEIFFYSLIKIIKQAPPEKKVTTRLELLKILNQKISDIKLRQPQKQQNHPYGLRVSVLGSENKIYRTRPSQQDQDHHQFSSDAETVEDYFTKDPYNKKELYTRSTRKSSDEEDAMKSLMNNDSRDSYDGSYRSSPFDDHLMMKGSREDSKDNDGWMENYSRELPIKDTHLRSSFKTNLRGNFSDDHGLNDDQSGRGRGRSYNKDSREGDSQDTYKDSRDHYNDGFRRSLQENDDSNKDSTSRRGYKDDVKGSKRSYHDSPRESTNKDDVKRSLRKNSRGSYDEDDGLNKSYDDTQRRNFNKDDSYSKEAHSKDVSSRKPYKDSSSRDDYKGSPKDNYKDSSSRNGYKDSAPRNTYKDSSSRDNYKDSSPRDDYKVSSAAKDDYKDSSSRKDYKDSSPRDDYKDSSSKDDYKASPKDNYKDSSSRNDYKDSSSRNAYKDSSSRSDYKDSSSKSDYKDSSSRSDYKDSSPRNTYKDSSSRDNYKDSSSRDNYKDSSSRGDYKDSSSISDYKDSSSRGDFKDSSSRNDYKDSSSRKDNDDDFRDDPKGSAFNDLSRSNAQRRKVDDDDNDQSKKITNDDLSSSKKTPNDDLSSKQITNDDLSSKKMNNDDLSSSKMMTKNDFSSKKITNDDLSSGNIHYDDLSSSKRITNDDLSSKKVNNDDLSSTKKIPNNDLSSNKITNDDLSSTNDVLSSKKITNDDLSSKKDTNDDLSSTKKIPNDDLSSKKITKDDLSSTNDVLSSKKITNDDLSSTKKIPNDDLSSKQITKDNLSSTNDDLSSKKFTKDDLSSTKKIPNDNLSSKQITNDDLSSTNDDSSLKKSSTLDRVLNKSLEEIKKSLHEIYSDEEKIEEIINSGLSPKDDQEIKYQIEITDKDSVKVSLHKMDTDDNKTGRTRRMLKPAFGVDDQDDHHQEEVRGGGEERVSTSGRQSVARALARKSVDKDAILRLEAIRRELLRNSFSSKSVSESEKLAQIIKSISQQIVHLKSQQEFENGEREDKEEEENSGITIELTPGKVGSKFSISLTGSSAGKAKTQPQTQGHGQMKKNLSIISNLKHGEGGLKSLAYDKKSKVTLVLPNSNDYIIYTPDSRRRGYGQSISISNGSSKEEGSEDMAKFDDGKVKEPREIEFGSDNCSASSLTIYANSNMAFSHLRNSSDSDFAIGESRKSNKSSS